MCVDLVFDVEFGLGASTDTKATIVDVLGCFVQKEDIALVFVYYYDALLEIVKQLFISGAHYLRLHEYETHFRYDDMGKEENQALPEYV